MMPTNDCLGLIVDLIAVAAPSITNIAAGDLEAVLSCHSLGAPACSLFSFGFGIALEAIDARFPTCLQLISKGLECALGRFQIS